MPNRFLAWISPVLTGGRPEHPIVLPPEEPGGPPLEIWGGANEPFPTPPIYIQIPPGIINGKPEHPIWWPVYPAHPIVIPPGLIDPGPPLVPAHPIVLPPHIWGGGNEPFPTPPIYLPPGSISPGHPEHPIYLPPIIWGPDDPRPTPPIHLPPIIKPQPPGGVVSPDIAYPIDLYARIPGLGVVGPITIHYPGPLPGHPLPGPGSGASGSGEPGTIRRR